MKSAIQEEMLAIKRAGWFEAIWVSFSKFVNSDPTVLFPEYGMKGRQAYLDQSTAFWMRSKRKLPDYFGILPKGWFVVKRVRGIFVSRMLHRSITTKEHQMEADRGLYYVHSQTWMPCPKNHLERRAFIMKGIRISHAGLIFAQELEVRCPIPYAGWRFNALRRGLGTLLRSLAKEWAVSKSYYDFGRMVK